MFENVGGSVVYYNDGGAGWLVALLFILLPLVLILAVAGYVLSSLFLMRIFEKAGVQGKWRAWVPVYNYLVFAKLGDTSPWVVLGALVAYAVLSQVPVLGFVLWLAYVAAIVLPSWRVGLKLGREWYWLLLWLIPGVGLLIWLGILAYDKSTWNPTVPAAPWAGNAFFSDRTTWSGIPAQATSPAPGYAAPPAPPTGYAPPAAQPPASPEPPAAPEEPKA